MSSVLTAKAGLEEGIRARMVRIERKQTKKRAAGKTVAVGRQRIRRSPMAWVVLILCVLLAVVILSPLLLMLLNSFKTSADYTQNGPLTLPKQLYFGGLIRFWERTNFPLKFWNSLWIAVCSALLAVALSGLNSFALGIGRIRGSAFIVGLYMILTMLPGEGFVYPLFYLFKAVGMTNTGWTIVIICGIMNMAFGTYLLSSVTSTFPRELLEAAQIDGAGRWRTLWQVVFPILRPTCSVLFVFFFIWTWNEFYFTLIFLNSNDVQTIPLAIASLRGDKVMDVPTLNAGSLVSLIPAIVFFLLFQRTLSKGLTAGAVK